MGNSSVSSSEEDKKMPAKKSTGAATKPSPVKKAKARSSCAPQGPPAAAAAAEHPRDVAASSAKASKATDNKKEATKHLTKAAELAIHSGSVPHPADTHKDNQSPDNETPEERRLRKNRINERRKRARRMMKMEYFIEQEKDFTAANAQLREENDQLRQKIEAIRSGRLSLVAKSASTATASQETRLQEGEGPPAKLSTQVSVPSPRSLFLSEFPQVLAASLQQQSQQVQREGAAQGEETTTRMTAMQRSAGGNFADTMPFFGRQGIPSAQGVPLGQNTYADELDRLLLARRHLQQQQQQQQGQCNIHFQPRSLQHNNNSILSTQGGGRSQQSMNRLIESAQISSSLGPMCLGTNQAQDPNGIDHQQQQQLQFANHKEGLFRPSTTRRTVPAAPAAAAVSNNQNTTSDSMDRIFMQQSVLHNSVPLKQENSEGVSPYYLPHGTGALPANKQNTTEDSNNLATMMRNPAAQQSILLNSSVPLNQQSSEVDLSLYSSGNNNRVTQEELRNLQAFLSAAVGSDALHNSPNHSRSQQQQQQPNPPLWQLLQANPSIQQWLQQQQISSSNASQLRLQHQRQQPLPPGAEPPQDPSDFLGELMQRPQQHHHQQQLQSNWRNAAAGQEATPSSQLWVSPVEAGERPQQEGQDPTMTALLQYLAMAKGDPTLSDIFKQLKRQDGGAGG